MQSWKEKAEENLRLYGKISPTWKDRPFYNILAPELNIGINVIKSPKIIKSYQSQKGYQIYFLL